MTSLAFKMLAGPLDNLLEGTSQFLFFKTINDFLRKEIEIFQWNLLSGTATIIGFAAMTILTVWIMFQGYRIVTGQSRQPMMGLVVDSLRAMLILFIATTAAAASPKLYWAITDGMTSAISGLVTRDTESPFEAIDSNLAKLQGAMVLIDAISTGNDKEAEDAKARNQWFTGIGIAGPAVVAGAMLLLNKIALALFVGFGPIFIVCLLFDQTKQLFSKWLLYGIGTVFSLATLSVMVTIAMKMMAAVTAAFLARYYAGLALGTSSNDGLNSMALQQGGLGFLLSTLIIMAPPIAATFFQGTLAQFQTYSPFGQIGRGTEAGSQVRGQQGSGVPGGQGGYIPPTNSSLSSGRSETNTHSINMNAVHSSQPRAPNADEIKRPNE